MAERKRPTQLTPEKEQVFLNSLAAGNTVVHASRAAGVTRATAYAQRKRSATFARAWAEAEEAGVQVMEQEAFRRAVKGLLKPVASAGKVVAHVREYSDTLLIFLLKARRPSVYRDTINVELYIRQAALDAGLNPDDVVAEAQA